MPEPSNTHLSNYPTPDTLNPFWSLGFVLGALIAVQFLTGIVLSTAYDVSNPYASMENFTREGLFQWFIRSTHQGGASFIFIALYGHFGKNLFFMNFFRAQAGVWWTGCCIFILLTATAFTGYVLPWNQIGYWAAVVISSLLGSMPVAGSSLLSWLWSGYSPDLHTLNTFQALHYVLPWVLLNFMGAHLLLLHRAGSNDSLVHTKASRKVEFLPYFWKKDVVVFTALFGFIIIFFLMYPTFFNDVQAYKPADPLTPVYVIPEWYFLPIFGLVKCVRSKLLGVSLIGFFFFLIAICPLVLSQNTYGYNSKNRTLYTFFVVNAFTSYTSLGWVAAQPTSDFMFKLNQFFVVWYFVSFVLLLITANSTKSGPA